MNLQSDTWNPSYNLLLLAVCVSSFVVPFACCLLCSSLCKFAIPELMVKVKSVYEIAEEEDESTTVTKLECNEKPTDIYWV